MIFFRASLETRKFHFEAFGLSADDVKMSLFCGLDAHGMQYALDRDWSSAYIGGLEIRQIELGASYRDGDQLSGQNSGPNHQRSDQQRNRDQAPSLVSHEGYNSADSMKVA